MASVVFMSCFEVSSAVRALASSKRSYRNPSVLIFSAFDAVLIEGRRISMCNQMVTSLMAREIIRIWKNARQIIP